MSKIEARLNAGEITIRHLISRLEKANPLIECDYQVDYQDNDMEGGFGVLIKRFMIEIGGYFVKLWLHAEFKWEGLITNAEFNCDPDNTDFWQECEWSENYIHVVDDEEGNAMDSWDVLKKICEIENVRITNADLGYATKKLHLEKKK